MKLAFSKFFNFFSTKTSPLSFLIHMRWMAWWGVLFALSLFNLFFSPQNLFFYSWFLWFLYGVSNFILNWVQSITKDTIEKKLVLATLIFDQVYLTSLILLNGGKHNPFAILFISITSVAAMILSWKELLSILCFSIACLIFIYWNPFAEPMEHAMHHSHGDYSFHLQGMFWANTLGAIIGSFWVYRLRKKNEENEAKARESQQLLFHLEKVESMGRLVATAAHRLNSPLATMQIAVSELSDEKNPLNLEEQKQYLKDMERAVSQITQTLAKITQAEKKTLFDKNKKFQLFDYLKLFAKNWARPRHCELHFNFSEKNLIVSYSVAEDIHTCLQVFLDNAWEAFQKKGTSKIKKNIKINAQNNENFFELEVIDNGVGIHRETLKKIGTPFFTTKKQGTGLGIYHCQQIAKKYRGNIEIDSQIDQETQVKLKIPLQSLQENKS